MKKTVGKVFTALFVALWIVAVLGFGVSFLIARFVKGGRFSADDAMEAVHAGGSQFERIETADGIFYYQTADRVDSTSESVGDWICNVTLISEGKLGMWKENASGVQTYPVCVEGAARQIGRMVTFQGSATETVFYHFFIPVPLKTSDTTPLNASDSVSLDLPKFLQDGYDSITVDGEQIALFHHSYFTSSKEILSFEINGVRLSTKFTSRSEGQEEYVRFESTVANARYLERGAYVNWAINASALGDRYHVPVYKCDSLVEFQRLAGLFSYGSYDNKTGFDEIAATVTEETFRNHSLLLIYKISPSGSLRYDISKITVTGSENGSMLTATVVQTNNPDMGTADMDAWVFFVPIDKTLEAGTVSFDAVFDSDFQVTYPTVSDAVTVRVDAFFEDALPKALNADFEESPKLTRLPIYKIASFGELEAYQKILGSRFVEATQPYHETFFETKSLVMVHLSASSGSYEYDVLAIDTNYDFYVTVAKTRNPSGDVTDDCADWVFLVPIDKLAASGVRRFDAFYERTDTVWHELFSTMRAAPIHQDGGALLAEGALNANVASNAPMDETLIHLPIFHFETLEELEAFKSRYADALNPEVSELVKTLDELTAEYDEEFFRKNELILVYGRGQSTSYRYGVHRAVYSGNGFLVEIAASEEPEFNEADIFGGIFVIPVQTYGIPMDAEWFDAVYLP